MADNKTKKELKIDDYEFASVTNTYTPEMLKDISKHSNAIASALSSIAKNYEKVIFNLYWIYKTKSYISFGYDSIITYASEKFGFKKSSTYDFIILAERFGNDDFTAFNTKYKDYEHSKLSLIADKSDTEIESLELKPDMSVKEIKALVKKHDSIINAVQDSADNESGSDSEKSDFQEKLVIKKNNEISLPGSAQSDAYDSINEFDNAIQSKKVRSFDVYDKFLLDILCSSVLNDYLDNHYWIHMHHKNVDVVSTVVIEKKYIYKAVTTGISVMFSGKDFTEFSITHACLNKMYIKRNADLTVKLFVGDKFKKEVFDGLYNEISEDLIYKILGFYYETGDFSTSGKLVIEINNIADKDKKEGGKDT